MSHELRTPLNAILGFTEMLNDGLYGEMPQGFREPLGDIQTNGKHLLRRSTMCSICPRSRPGRWSSRWRNIPRAK